MGTSSTKRGRIDNDKTNALWRNFKNSASRFFSGNGTFESAMSKCISAHGGVGVFSASKSEKKNAIIGNVLNVVFKAKDVGLRQTASSYGIELSDDLTNEQILVLIGNKLLEGTDVTGEDSFVREETLSYLLSFSTLFDENGQLTQSKAVIEAEIIAIAEKDMANDIFNAFVEACPMSTEKDNADLVTAKLNEARSKIDKAVKEEFNKGSFDANNYLGSFNKIKENVLKSFVIEGELN